MKAKASNSRTGKNTLDKPVHVFVYGDVASQKSTFAASFPPPILVLFTDGLGMEEPYRRRFLARSCKERHWRGEQGQSCISFTRDEKEICRVEMYHNTSPAMNCQAFPRLHARLQHLATPEEMRQWRTCVLDGCTGLIDIALEYQEFEVNPGAADDKQLRWLANVTNNAHAILKGLSYLPLNVVVISHIQGEKTVMRVGREASAAPIHPLQRGLTEFQDAYVRSVALPGRLGRNINIVASRYPEFYRAYIDDNGAARLQTEPNGEWVAKSTVLGVRTGIRPRYSDMMAAARNIPQANQREGEKEVSDVSGTV